MRDAGRQMQTIHQEAERNLEHARVDSEDDGSVAGESSVVNVSQ